MPHHGDQREGSILGCPGPPSSAPLGPVVGLPNFVIHHGGRHSTMVGHTATSMCVPHVAEPRPVQQSHCVTHPNVGRPCTGAGRLDGLKAPEGNKQQEALQGPGRHACYDEACCMPAIPLCRISDLVQHASKSKEHREDEGGQRETEGSHQEANNHCPHVLCEMGQAAVGTIVFAGLKSFIQ